MPYCSECGVELTTDQKFCRECRVSLEDNPPELKEENETANQETVRSNDSSFFGKLQATAEDAQKRAENMSTEQPYKLPSDALMMASGVNGQVILFENKIRIARKGVKLRYKMSQLGKGDKEIRLDNITSVQLKEPGMTNGYIQFGQSGYSESSQGAFDAASDENSVMFMKGNLEEFKRLSDKIEELSDNGSAPASVSGDNAMAKLREMYAMGEIDEEEYKKRKSILEE